MQAVKNFFCCGEKDEPDSPSRSDRNNDDNDNDNDDVRPIFNESYWWLCQISSGNGIKGNIKDVEAEIGNNKTLISVRYVDGSDYTKAKFAIEFARVWYYAGKKSVREEHKNYGEALFIKRFVFGDGVEGAKKFIKEVAIKYELDKAVFVEDGYNDCSKKLTELGFKLQLKKLNNNNVWIYRF